MPSNAGKLSTTLGAPVHVRAGDAGTKFRDPWVHPLAPRSPEDQEGACRALYDGTSPAKPDATRGAARNSNLRPDFNLRVF